MPIAFTHFMRVKLYGSIDVGLGPYLEPREVVGVFKDGRWWTEETVPNEIVPTMFLLPDSPD